MAAALPGCLGLWLLSWVDALSLGSCLGLGLHWDRGHQWLLSWRHLAPSLGAWADLHLP